MYVFVCVCVFKNHIQKPWHWFGFVANELFSFFPSCFAIESCGSVWAVISLFYYGFYKKKKIDEVKLFVVGPYCLEWLRYSTAKIYANKVCSSFGEFRIKTQTIHCIYCPYLFIIAHSIVDELIVCLCECVLVCSILFFSFF